MGHTRTHVQVARRRPPFFSKRKRVDPVQNGTLAILQFPDCKEILKSAGFSHDAKRNPCMLVVSWRLAMNFAREPFFAEPRRKSGSMCRSAVATTNSDGGMPGRMVRSHDPNESQTSLEWTTARYWSRPWATTPA